MKNLKESNGTRLVIIGILTLVLLIPALLIQNLISERENRRDLVTEEINQKWGAKQTIIGPIITVPYKHYFNIEGKVQQTTRYAHFLPKNLNVNGSIQPEVRYRGIFEVIVYNSNISVSGNFTPLNFNSLSVEESDYLFDDAFVSVGITDMSGINNFINISWNEEEFIANPGIATTDILKSGISITPEIKTDTEYNFEFEINLNGSTGLLFAPVGEETLVEINSKWPNPSFSGKFLPTEREVSEIGFTSSWKILHLNRNFPQQWTGENMEVNRSTFGVDLLLAVDEYQKTMRTAKYAIMFISLTFLTFYMMEILSSKALHPMQYLLIGFALLVFYTLLLSISEYLVFKYAYLISSIAVILLITVYSHRILGDKIKTVIVGGVLLILYGYLYILLQLQDFALLLGSIALFAVLAILMYLTRSIDWFKVMGTQTK